MVKELRTKSRRRKASVLERQVERTIRKFDMVQAGQHVLLAVSGGADSTALLVCFHKIAPNLGLALSLAHLNHGLRGPESDADEEFVRRLSDRFGIPFQSEKVDLRKESIGQNLEQTARQMRYEFLKRAAARVGAHRIAVGHTLNDQAETVLFRFVRGSGVDGLSGIHPVVDGLVIRPLLECSRRAVLDYLSIQEIGYCEDSSNMNLAYRRNRIRHESIPYFEENFNPRVVETLARHADHTREIAEYLEFESRRIYETLRTRQLGGLALPFQKILALHPALRKLVVRQAIRDCRRSLRGITSKHINDALQLSGGQSGNRIPLPGGYVARREFGSLLIVENEDAGKSEYQYNMPIPGRCVVPEVGMEFLAAISSADTPAVAHGAQIHEALLDRDCVPNGLIIRSRQPGDRYGGHPHRRVKEMLIKAKMPLERRLTLPMVVSGDSVVWIPGFAPAKSFIPKPDSDRWILLWARGVPENRVNRPGSL